MIQRSLATLLILLLGASAASAQGLRHDDYGRGGRYEFSLVLGRKSADEVRYVKNLARSLGAVWYSRRMVGRYYQAHTPPRAAPLEPYPTVRGLRVNSRGVKVFRLRFETSEYAQGYAASFARTRFSPTFIEVRGTQLVIARGKRVANPQDLPRIRRAAWALLPHPVGAPSMAGVTLSEDEHAFESRVHNRDLAQTFRIALRRQDAKLEDLAQGPLLVESLGVSQHFTASGNRRAYWRSSGNTTEDGELLIKVLAEGLLETSERLAAEAKASPALTEKSPAVTSAKNQSKGTQSNGTQREGIRAALDGLRRLDH